MRTVSKIAKGAAKLIVVACMVAFSMVAYLKYLNEKDLICNEVVAGSGVNSGDFVLSDEPIHDSGYSYELTYQLLGSEDYKYLYLEPKTGSVAQTAALSGYRYGSYYAYIYCDGLELGISSGTCYVEIDGGGSFVTNVFSLREVDR